MPKKFFTQELEGTRRRGRPWKGWKEEAERDLKVLGVRRWRELVAKMEGHCSRGQSPQWAAVPMEGEQITAHNLQYFIIIALRRTMYELKARNAEELKKGKNDACKIAAKVVVYTEALVLPRIL